MVVVPLTKGEFEPGVGTRVDRAECTNWIRYAAAGTLAASGVLLVTGQRRLGLVAVFAGFDEVAGDGFEAVGAAAVGLEGGEGFVDELRGVAHSRLCSMP
jgi:hypothetical protein